MTGYGHFTYFYKKNDFSLARVSKVLLRLNLLTAAMSYVMDQPLPFYYFAPLVSFWFLVIFGLMSVCKDSKGNHNAVLLKSLLCGATTRLFIHSPICLGMLFDLTQKLLKTDQWNAKEFGFRLALDEWVVYLGTAMAFASIWITRYLGSVPLSTPSNFSPLARMAIVDPIHWRKLKGLVLLVSAVSVLFFIFVNMSVQDKFEYNRLHPWLSLFPVGGFVVLRNSTETLRRTTSTFWKWVGGFSLESFLLQVTEYVSLRISIF